MTNKVKHVTEMDKYGGDKYLVAILIACAGCVRSDECDSCDGELCLDRHVWTGRPPLPRLGHHRETCIHCAAGGTAAMAECAK